MSHQTSRSWFSANSHRIMLPVKPIVKRVAITLGVLVFLVVALGFIGFHWGLTPLPKPPQGVRIEPLHPPLTRENLTPDNGAFHYMQAVDFIEHHHLPNESENQMRALLAGSIPSNTNSLEQTISDYRPALDLVRHGAHASSCQMPQLNLDIDTNALASLRLAGRLLIADGKLAENERDFTRAIDDYLTVVKFGTDCAKGGPILYALVGDAIGSLGTQAIRAYVLQNTNPSDGTQNIMENLSRINSERVPFAETLRYEREFTKEQLSHQILMEAGPRERTFYSRRVTDCYLDAAFGELIEDADKPFWKSNAKAIARKWYGRDMPWWFVVFNRPIPRVLVAMTLPAIESARNKPVRADLEFEATEVACALKSYEFNHGASPEQLTDLVPTFLSPAPIDPYDGKPLRYRREGKEWVLWSVGADLKDDDAAWHEYKYRKDSDDRKGGDIFFKSTEPQDDLAFHLSQQKLKASGPTRSPRTPTASP